MDTAIAIRRLHLQAAFLDADTPDVTRLLRELLAQLEPLEQRALVRHAYWRMPEVPTGALRQAVDGDGPLRDLAGRGPVVGTCERCDRVLRALSRDDVDREGPGRCAACRTRPASDGGLPGPVAPVQPGFGWEFEERPVPWRPVPVRSAAAGVRRWAEHYPETA